MKWILQKTDIGATLTTWLYCHFWMLWSLEQSGNNDVYISWPDGYTPGRCLVDLIDKKKFAEQSNMFEWYFKQPKVKDGGINAVTLIWEHWRDPCPVSFMAQPLQVIKDYYQKHLHFSDEVEARGQALVAKYNIDFSNTIGVTWRGTDNVTDGRPRMPIERYFKHIDKLLSEKPNLQISCTAEEEGILEPLLKQYPSAFKIEEFISSPFQSIHNPERISNVSGFERGLQPALMVWLFSKCEYYIKNRSSTGGVASWLSNGLIVNLGHPETLSHENHIDKDEIKGVLYDS